ncbi:MAG: hypothetical protein MRZ45_03420 [Blautia sp.]|nr:hypothetical protein [Blautia sp.]
MPVTLNGMYDALLVVLDERNVDQDSFFKKELERTFDKRKYVYYQDRSMSADQLWNELDRKIGEDAIIFPVSQRIVFCTYMDICDLDETWLARFRERMKIFKTRGMTQTGFQHYHMTFFRYEARHPLGTEKVARVTEILNELWNPSAQYMHHSEFLMYAGGLGATLNTQEKGMIRCLELLGTKDYAKAINIENLTDALFVLEETEYYERHAQNCQDKIRELEQWLNREMDPNLDDFIQRINIKVSDWMNRYQEEMRQFQKGTGLYPVSVSEYTAKGFGPFRKYERPAGLHPQLKNEKERCQKEFLKRIAVSDEKEEWKQRVRQEMALKDLQNLSLAAREGRLGSMLQNAVSQSEAAQRLQKEEQDSIAEAFEKWVDEFIREEATEEKLQSLKNEYNADLLRYQNEFSKASVFPNLDTCFRQIRSATRFQVPAIVTTTDVEQVAIINGQVGEDWKIRGYAMEGIQDNDIIVLNDIYPYEIVYMKFGKYITLNRKETEQQISMVLR